MLVSEAHLEFKAKFLEYHSTKGTAESQNPSATHRHPIYVRPKKKKKLETTDRAEEPCNVDSDDEEFSDCDDGFGAVINDEMRRGAIAVTSRSTERIERASLLKLHS